MIGSVIAGSMINGVGSGHNGAVERESKGYLSISIGKPYPFRSDPIYVRGRCLGIAVAT